MGCGITMIKYVLFVFNLVCAVSNMNNSPLASVSPPPPSVSLPQAILYHVHITNWGEVSVYSVYKNAPTQRLYVSYTIRVSHFLVMMGQLVAENKENSCLQFARRCLLGLLI